MDRRTLLGRRVRSGCGPRLRPRRMAGPAGCASSCRSRPAPSRTCRRGCWPRSSPSSWASRSSSRTAAAPAAPPARRGRARSAGRLTLLLTDNSLSISPGLYPNLPYDPLRDWADQPHRGFALDPAGAAGPRHRARSRNWSRSRKQKPARSPSAPAGRDRRRISRWSCCSTSPAPRRCTCHSAASRRRSRRSSPAASTWRSRASPPAWRMCRPARCIGLGVSGAKRSSLLPDVPTFAEAGEPRYDMSYWWGIAAPAGTPPADHRAAAPRDRARLRKAAAARGIPASRPRSPSRRRPEEMARHLEREIGVWREVIARAKVTIQ